jgi:hypothetical protein
MEGTISLASLEETKNINPNNGGGFKLALKGLIDAHNNELQGIHS